MITKPNITDIEQRLNHHAEDLRNWISKTHSIDDIENGNIDESAYPNWKTVSDDISLLLNQYDIRDLSNEGVTTFIYLIGRNWDMCWIINWLSAKSESFSNLGPLNEEQLYFLCEKSFGIDDDDALSQLSASFEKFDRLNVKREELLLNFIKEKNSYTRIRALNSLYKLDYERIEEIIELEWEKEDWPFRKRCINILAELNSTKVDFFKSKIDRAENELRVEADKLRNNLNNNNNMC